MQKPDYSIRTMTRSEVSLAIDWAAREGWNPGLQDADSYYAADPNGFLVGLRGAEPVACTSVIRYGDSFGFLGFYMVRPEYRGQGYGIRIWNAGLKYLQGRTVGLDGVVDQQDNYRRSGFTLAYRNIRYAGSGGATPGLTSADTDTATLVELATLPPGVLEGYDRAFFPDDRRRFIHHWVQQPGCQALGILQDGVLAGYAVMRPCLSGYKVGPLFADGPELAETLFVALKSRLGAGDTLYLDTPEVNPAAVMLAQRHDMTVAFETARMYTGEAPVLPLQRIYGVTSFEVG
ncbi:GNAT family N-acetyltransferase [Marinobacterium rhizophilum]|uniref:GNAT family N-acetyltransferase n=1 Tax=Marinobacterium rhizophilum TaxID=420402 RepID=A0ABY5HNG5_9GAMM|nr:GNAT family N-acetyltransferase [Marinobacterium rhizophilum]UTW13406.1 GNAT family N-acetyltransferase [Marinobacterium rhizophilum]